MDHLKAIRVRTLLISGVFIFFVVIILIRLFWVQVINYEFYEAHNEQTWSYSTKLPASRGDILDRNGKLLAATAPSYHVILHPAIIAKNKQEQVVITELSRLLSMPKEKLAKLVAQTDLVQVEIWPSGRNISFDRMEEFTDVLGEFQQEGQDAVFYTYGIRLQRDVKRYYPYDKLASHTLGYMNREGKAIMGIEHDYNHILSGTDGYLTGQRDRKGYPLPHTQSKVTKAKDGQDIQLTIDADIQFVLDKALRDTVGKWKPKYAVGYVMDPKTMELLAVSSMPDYNPNSYWDISSDLTQLKNNALQATFEPGSTFKLLTLAAAVEHNVFDPGDNFQSGRIVVQGSTIHDVRRDGWGSISYLEGLKKSSNVAFVKLGMDGIGEDRFMDFANKFRMNGKTGIDLKGEKAGSVTYNRPVEFATATFGQGGVVINGLQLVSAYAAIANGGEWITPHLVKSVGDQGRPNIPIVKERIVTKQTADQVSLYLEEVVKDGTGKLAQIEGVRVAGKTGTAQRVVGSGYSDSTWLVSFVGYAPVEDPQLVVGIIVDDPQLNGEYTLAGQVTMTAFKETMEQSLRLIGYKPKAAEAPEAKEIEVKVPDIKGLTVAEGYRLGGESELQVKRLGNGQVNVSQFPEAGSIVNKGSTVYVLTEEIENIAMPSLEGLALRDALVITSLLDVVVAVSGEGYVAKQTWERDGDRTSTLMLELAPKSEVEQVGQGEQADQEAQEIQGEQEPSGEQEKEDPVE